MWRLVIRNAAKRDIADILDYVTRESGSLVIGRRLVGQITQKVEHLSTLPVQMGRDRSELGEGLRSFPFKGYMLFFRYRGTTMEVVNVVHGSRDIETFFADDL